MGLCTFVSSGDNAADKVARQGALLMVSAIPCSLSALTIVSTLVFSWIGGVSSHLNSLTQKFPRFSPRSLCCFATLAVILKRTQPAVKLLSLYNWQNRESLM